MGDGTAAPTAAIATPSVTRRRARRETANGSLAPASASASASASVSVFTAACVSKAIAGRVARAPKTTGQGREMRGQPGSPPTGGRNAGGGVLAPRTRGRIPDRRVATALPNHGPDLEPPARRRTRAPPRWTDALRDRIARRSVNVGPASASSRPALRAVAKARIRPGERRVSRPTRTAAVRPPAVAAEDRAPPPRPTSG